MKIDAKLFLGDFEAEAKLHIDKIETAFLDISVIENNIKLMNSVFRAAHSLKGTAGFLSLDKIVAVTHELESIFSKLKEEMLTIDIEIADIVLKCVDCLKDLLENIHNDESICIKEIVNSLKKYTFAVNDDNNGNENAKEIFIPFNFNDIETENNLKNMSRYGHKIYYVNIGFNRSLGKYYKNPKGMIDNIFSVGFIVQAVIAGSNGRIIENTDIVVFSNDLIKALKEHDTCTLEILVTSVLELDLFSVAIGVDKKQIKYISRDIAFGEERNEKTEIPKNFPEEKKNKSLKALTENEKSYKQSASQRNNISIRLDISDINRLMDLANEMVLTRNQLFSVVSEHKKNIYGLVPILHDINHLTREIQEKVMFTRMQPISVIFNRFPRIIRDTAKALNKDITVNILKDDITLDKYLLEALADPITQLVKNSADHGMESAEQREKSGKPARGVISLNAYMRDGSAIIEVSDDGGGIDVESLKKKAVECGMITEENLASMQKNEIYNLIFKPGISTARKITSLSGRGIGMDIVKTNIEKSGGSIEIESEAGKGTTIRLKMPLTLTVINTLIVNIDSITYAVPELNIEHIVRFKSKTDFKQRIEKVNKSLVLSFNGRLIPVITMSEIEARAKDSQPISADAVLERNRRSDVTKCLILRADGKSFALLIDEAVETEQILVKPLPVYLQNCPCYLCVTVLGNGKAVTVLDAAGIMRFMGIEDIEREAAQHLIPASGIDTEKKQGIEKQVIIFCCSGKEYFAVETCDISRIEIINTKDIQEIGDEQFINIAGISRRAVRPENYVPVDKRDYTEDKLFLLTLKNMPSIGLLVRKVIDKAEDIFTLDNRQIYSDFIFGTGIFNEKILIFLNPAAIAQQIEKNKENRKIVYKGKIS